MSSALQKSPYRGRFAPSPTGLLHAGSLVAALASWLDARAHDGRWLVRIEDIDAPRCIPGADLGILKQLRALGMVADEPPIWQSTRVFRYETALAHLVAQGWAYPCGCSRGDIMQALVESGRIRKRHATLAYPGTCRGGLQGKPARAMRLRVAPAIGRGSTALRLAWHDRRLGAQDQDVSETIGDFVLKRADGWWAYQLAVTVDDAAQGITHVVRGEDLADNTPRQIHLQRVLGVPTPSYLHTPLVLGRDGEKLSKQNGARALALERPLEALRAAGLVLGVQAEGSTPQSWLASAAQGWRAQWRLRESLGQSIPAPPQ